MRSWVRHLPRLPLGALLLWAGAAKLGEGWDFAATIEGYRLLSAPFNQLLAVTLPWWELAAGLGLILSLWTRPAAVLSLLLFVAFTIATASAWARGLDVDCACFGSANATSSGLRTLLVDIAGLASSCWVLWLESKPAGITGVHGSHRLRPSSQEPAQG